MAKKIQPLRRLSYSSCHGYQDDHLENCFFKPEALPLAHLRAVTTDKKFSDKIFNKAKNNSDSTTAPSGPFDLPSACEDQKGFLLGSQILEKLKLMIEKCVQNKDGKYLNPFSGNSLEEPSSHISNNRILKKLVMYHDKLRNLLLQRCILVFKQDCIHCVEQSRILFKECKLQTIDDKVKLQTLPLKIHNRFTDSSGLNLLNLNLLVNKFNDLINQWHVVINSLQKIINIFHSGFSLQVHQLFYQMNILFISLKQCSLYWVYCNFLCNIQKLCIVSSDCISTEAVQYALETFDSFNKFVYTQKTEVPSGDTQTHSFCSCSKFEVEPLSCSTILSYLFTFEADTAAERILQVIVSTSQKDIKLDFKSDYIFNLMPNVSIKRDSLQDSTSGYCSNSVNDADVQECSDSKKMNIKKSGNITSNLISVLASLLHKNQALLLKYLFAVKCFNSVKVNDGINRVKCDEKSRQNSAMRKVWKLTPQKYQDVKSCTHLEKFYWSGFWNKVQSFLLNFLIEVPCHQYNNAVIGSIILWNESLLFAVMQTFSQSCDTDDVCAEGRVAIRETYFQMYAFVVQILWDKRLYATLSIMENHSCVAVPVIGSKVQTETGNLLRTAFEPLASFFLIFGLYKESTNSTEVRMRIAVMLLISLDIILNWAVVKQRALLSSENLSFYLIIGYSDVMAVHQLLEHINQQKIFRNNCLIDSVHAVNLLDNMYNSIFEKITELESLVVEIPSVLYKKVYLLTSYLLSSEMHNSSCFRSLDTSITSEDIIKEVINSILNPINETVKCLPSQRHVLSKSVNAVFQAFCDFLQDKNFSAHKKIMLTKDAKRLNEWVEELSLSSDETCTLKTIDSIQNLSPWTKFFLLFHCPKRALNIRNNKVVPH